MATNAAPKTAAPAAATPAAPAGAAVAPGGAATGAPRPCAFFRKGICRNGTTCPFAHVAAPPKKPAANGERKAPAAGAATGAGAAPAGARPRADPKVTQCKFWGRGTCRAGKDCQFLHTGESGHAAKAAAATAPAGGPGAAAGAAKPAAAAGAPAEAERGRRRRRGGGRRAAGAGAAAAPGANAAAAKPAGGAKSAAKDAKEGEKAERQISAARAVRKAIAEDTLKILNGMGYKTEGGKSVDLRAAITAAVSGAKLYKASENPSQQWAEKKVNGSKKTKIEIVNATTLGASRKLVADVKKPGAVVALNFASAKHPGGGFQTGAQAQEESLARSSALYSTLTTASTKELYDTNTAAPNKGLYSHAAIFSPNVPVFRGDDNKLFDEPFNLSFITCPAVNAGVAARGNRPDRPGKADAKDATATATAAPAKPADAKEKEALKAEAKKLIGETMLERIDRILAIALLNGATHIVLGAYGCGVFRNAAADVSGYFRTLLTGKGKYAGQFDTVLFAVVEDRNNQSSDKKEKADAKAAATAAAAGAAVAGADKKDAKEKDNKKSRDDNKPRESKLAVFIEKFKDVLTSPPPALAAAAPAPAAAATAAAPAAAANKK